jgi:hypothetical protein
MATIFATKEKHDAFHDTLIAAATEHVLEPLADIIWLYARDDTYDIWAEVLLDIECTPFIGKYGIAWLWSIRQDDRGQLWVLIGINESAYPDDVMFDWEEKMAPDVVWAFLCTGECNNLLKRIVAAELTAHFNLTIGDILIDLHHGLREYFREAIDNMRMRMSLKN